VTRRFIFNVVIVNNVRYGTSPYTSPKKTWVSPPPFPTGEGWDTVPPIEGAPREAHARLPESVIHRKIVLDELAEYYHKHFGDEAVP